MDKRKIHIDQYFKTSLQNFEGEADDAMFDSIKSKVEASQVSIDDYFKLAMLGVEGNADDLSFDSIKNKIESPKVALDSYFKGALLDYNSSLPRVPFHEILNKLDREKIIDTYFKNALLNFEGKTHDEEFTLIRNRVQQLQQKQSRKRYAWLLLILLLPAWNMGYKFFHQASTKVNSDFIVTEQTKPENSQTNRLPNLKKGESENSNHTVLRAESEHNNQTYRGEVTPLGQVLSSTSDRRLAAANLASTVMDNNATILAALKQAEANAPVQHNIDTATTSKEKMNNQGEMSAVPSASQTEAAATPPNDLAIKPANTNIHKRKAGITVDVFGAAALNSRFLHTNNNSSQYFATRSASDKQTTKYGYGINLFKNFGKINVGVGLHENQFGQSGAYQITNHLYDSVPYININHDTLYFRYNERDSAFHYAYKNTFTMIEIPLQFSYLVCTRQNWDFEVGAGVLMSYLAGANGAMPNASSTEIVELKKDLQTLNRIGSAISANMKFHYFLTPHWQLGTDIYLKSNITSVYRKSTGITELPYSFGWRCGIGFKF